MSLKLFALAMIASSVSFASAQDDSSMHMKARYGGPVYTGSPALDATASLVQAGGGADNFSIVTAVTSMVGADTANAEIAKLTKQYGQKRVDRFVAVFNFAVEDSLKMATAAGVTLPTPTLSGTGLAKTLIQAGMADDGTFWTGFLLDKAVTHKIHMAVMDDIDKKYGADADKDYHRISNQEHYDAGKALGVDGIKLASLH